MTTLVTLSTRRFRRQDGPSLGTLSVHLDGGVCRVGCAFCYLGPWKRPAPPDQRSRSSTEALGALRYDEVAVAVSRAARARRCRACGAIVAAARAPVAVTTTPQLARRRDRPASSTASRG